MKNFRQLAFCLFTALMLISVGVVTASENAYHWGLYVVGGLLSVLSITAYRQQRSKTNYSMANLNADRP
ncbi:hypothetical protein [Aliikangiella maris]|uniref:YiaAB two helix domain-containing protein n=2 Tax=Aliikangiella maris TaxID=3162458 RepID=A0ABV3MUK1_9GAMM